MSVRTRVAPSPTGDPHVGTAYMALFNYCFAKQHGGQFLLRIEDTDQVRSTLESEAMILKSLRWLGLSWDEGPDVGGPNGPYRQSERSAIYQEHVATLIDAGHAFRCFCTAERLTALRKSQLAAKVANLGYDGHCMGLSAAESEDRAGREPFVVRMKVPRDGQCTVHDRFRGPIHFDWAQVDMQVLLKTDGLPTYHLANVVDDHLMGITHVMRGEEWTTSAPKHLLLYKYFGWEAPQLAHMPLLRNPDKSKLSKRKNPTSILWYQRMGFLPEALLNYLAMMAWSMPNAEEKFSLDEMVAAFDIDRISVGGPVFDLSKLDWLNGRWIRENLSPEEFGRRVQQWALNPDYLGQIAPLAQKRVTKLSDLGNMVNFFFSGVPEYPVESLYSAKLDKEATRQVLYVAMSRFDRLKAWTKEGLEEQLRVLADERGLKLKDFLRPFYVANTGNPVSVPLFDTMALLGRDLVRHRMRHALTQLGWPTNAEREAWDKLSKADEADEAQ